MIVYDLQTLTRQDALVTTATLSQLSLDHFPEALRTCRKLEILDLSDNHISDVPSWLADLTRLRIVRLSGNHLKQVPPAIFRLSRLQELHLANNQLYRAEGLWARLTQLNVLDLSGNKLRHLPEDLPGASSLRTLKAGHNPLGTFPAAILHLSQLRHLALPRARIKSLPDQIDLLPQLIELNLDQNQISEIPLALTKIATLQSVHFAANGWSNVPHELLRCRFLRKLNLRRNKLTVWPKSGLHLPWLGYLNLHGNQLDRLPKNFGQNTRLETILLSQNHLRTLPDLSNLTNLRRLDLRNNRIERLPPLPDRLQELIVRNNRQLAIPQIKGGAGLLRLDVSYTQFSGPDRAWDNTQNLRELVAYQTPLAQKTELPVTLLSLTGLTRLSGLRAGQERKRLLRILAIARQESINYEDRRRLFLALGADKDQVRDQSLAWHWQILHWPFSELWPISRETLLNKNGITPEESLLQQEGVALLGQFPGERRKIRRALQKYKIPELANGIRVLGRPPYEPATVWHDQMKLVDVATLKQWLTQPDNTPTLNASQMQNVRRLLLSPNPVNQRLALQLIRSQGVPNVLFPDLIVRWKQTRDTGLQREIRQILVNSLPAGDQVILQKRIAFPTDLSGSAFRQKLKELLEGSSFHLEDFHPSLFRK